MTDLSVSTPDLLNTEEHTCCLFDRSPQYFWVDPLAVHPGMCAALDKAGISSGSRMINEGYSSVRQKEGDHLQEAVSFSFCIVSVLLDQNYKRPLTSVVVLHVSPSGSDLR